MGAFRVPATLVRLGARLVSRRTFDPALPWEVQRRRLDRLVRAWPLRRGTSVTTTVLNGVPAEVVTAAGGHAVTVVHFHGGGYCVGSPAEARDWAAHVSARADCRVILPDYRLAPEHPYPAAVEDARAVVRAVLAETEPGSGARSARRD
jgi:acetyl esterase/lipase